MRGARPRDRSCVYRHIGGNAPKSCPKSGDSRMRANGAACPQTSIRRSRDLTCHGDAAYAVRSGLRPRQSTQKFLRRADNFRSRIGQNRQNSGVQKTGSSSVPGRPEQAGGHARLGPSSRQPSGGGPRPPLRPLRSCRWQSDQPSPTPRSCGSRLLAPGRFDTVSLTLAISSFQVLYFSLCVIHVLS